MVSSFHARWAYGKVYGDDRPQRSAEDPMKQVLLGLLLDLDPPEDPFAFDVGLYVGQCGLLVFVKIG